MLIENYKKTMIIKQNEKFIRKIASDRPSTKIST